MRQVRISKEMREIMDKVKIEFMRRGKPQPSFKRISDIIAKKIKKEDLVLDDVIIRF